MGNGQKRKIVDFCLVFDTFAQSRNRGCNHYAFYPSRQSQLSSQYYCTSLGVFCAHVNSAGLRQYYIEPTGISKSYIS